MREPVSPLEKKVITTALIFSAALLSLIAYSALRLGIGVPSCVTNVAPFTKGELIRISERRYEIHFVAKMWDFEPNRVLLPVGSVADIYVTSRDVTHGLHINGTNVNLMAVPFVVNYAQVKFDRPGTYPVLCHEYCGTGHQAMSGAIEVRADLQEGRIDGVAGALPSGVQAAAPSAGRKLLDAKACLACHSLDGKPGVGPSFLGIWGSKEELADGTTVVVDAAHIKESILEPQKKVKKGFAPVMPKLPVTEAEAGQIADFLKTLK